VFANFWDEFMVSWETFHHVVSFDPETRASEPTFVLYCFSIHRQKVSEQGEENATLK
jgi:hypothetical protein